MTEIGKSPMAMNRRAQRAALLELGAMVAERMKEGEGGHGRVSAIDALSSMPEASVELMGLIEKEARKKRPDPYLVAALAFVAAQALELLRYRIERADPAAAATLGETQRRLVAHARSDRADPAILMLMVRQFAAAKLDIGETLRDAMGRMIADEAEDEADDAGADGVDMERHLADLGRELGDDPFLIHAELAETAGSFPVEHRLAMAGVMLGSASRAVREAALGWLFDGAREARAAVAAMLADRARAGLLDAATLRRLVVTRNWLPVAERAPVDDGIKAARLKGGEPEALPGVRIECCVASPFDGSGAGSAFVMARIGRRYVVASLLFKLGIGLGDAWAQRDLGKAEAQRMIDGIAGEIGTSDVSVGHVGRALQHALGVHVAAGTLPPFGTLGCTECLGLGPVNPREVAVEDAIAEALEAGPRRDAEAEILARSADWLERYAFMDSWFEDDATVDAALDGRKSLSRARKVDLVVETVVAPRRRRWAELLAWTALVAAEDEDGKADAAAFAVVAQALLSDRPAREIPLLRAIAAATVEARRRRRQ